MNTQQHEHDKLVAVVVTYNRLAQLQITLRSLLQASLADLAAIVVVNNASTDGTGAWLEAQTDERLVIHNCSENIGGAGGFKTGMQIAAEDLNADWIVLMDDDARPELDALRLFHEADRSTADAWAAAIYEPCGKICDMNRPSLNPFWHRSIMIQTLLGKGRNGFHFGEKEYASGQITQIDGTSFVGFFISKDAIRRFGYPDAKLFVYGDDILFTLQMTKGGAVIKFDPSLRFEHDFSSIVEGSKRFSPLWKSYYHYRNLLLVYKLAAGMWFYPIFPAIAIKWLSKIRHHKHERRAYLMYVGRAIWHGITRNLDTSHDTVLGWHKD